MNFEKINLVKLCMLIRRNVNTTEELNRVIHAVNMTAKRIRSMESAKAKISLAVGDTVTFTGKRNKKMKGIITKMKLKKALVRCKNDQGANVLWDCPFSMLEVV